MLRALPLALLAPLLGCGSDLPLLDADAGTRPPSSLDAGHVGGELDAGQPDAGLLGGGEPDGGGTDGGGLDAGRADAGGTDAGGRVGDLDRDGLDDAWELEVATRYLPALSLHPQDRCPLGGLVFRLRPHPMDPDGGLLAITWTHLFERDCGLTSHVGDNEAFGATIDPTLPADQGLLVLRAVAHQATVCSRTSTCGRCAGMTPCERATPTSSPRLYSSRDKHAGYVSLSACGTLTCLDTCAPGLRTGVPQVNAGEPGAPLTRDLTDAGFITAANGWTERSLFNFDPWGTLNFGRAGNVKGDLEDPAFLTPACR